MSNLGIQIGASTPPSQLADVARRAENLGYCEMWFAENYFELGGIATVGTALAATESIPVGLGVLAARVRHPAVTAMELATLAGAYPDRFMAGLGHGALGWMRQMGLELDTPMGLLREATTAIRQLLEGATVSVSGAHFQFHDVRLDHPSPTRVPLYFGVQGPASLRLGGELADGSLLGWFTSPAAVVWARQQIDEGRARAERADTHEVVALCLLSISSRDPNGIGRAFANWAAPMLTGLARSKSLHSSPEGEELSHLVEAAGGEDLGQKIPLSLLRQFAAVGSPDDCAATVARLREAGADRVVLVPNPAGFRSTAEMIGQIAAAQVLLE